MAVVSDYNPGDLLTGTAGDGDGGESAVKDLSINEEVVMTLAAFADMQEDGVVSPALLNHTRELIVKQEHQPQSIMPTDEGTIFMAWFKENGSMNMEFLADGTAEVYIEDEVHEELETFIPATLENFTFFVNGFYNNVNFIEY